MTVTLSVLFTFLFRTAPYMSSQTTAKCTKKKYIFAGGVRPTLLSQMKSLVWVVRLRIGLSNHPLS